MARVFVFLPRGGYLVLEILSDQERLVTQHVGCVGSKLQVGVVMGAGNLRFVSLDVFDLLFHSESLPFLFFSTLGIYLSTEYTAHSSGLTRSYLAPYLTAVRTTNRSTTGQPLWGAITIPTSLMLSTLPILE